MIFKLSLIAIGGAIGALLRYFVSGIAYKYMEFLEDDFPWGTLTVNLLGAFLIGFLWVISEKTFLSPQYKFLIFVGFLGAFTTFSTYGLETLNLMYAREVKLAFYNILISNLGGIFCVWMGMFLARYLLRVGK